MQTDELTSEGQRASQLAMARQFVRFKGSATVEELENYTGSNYGHANLIRSLIKEGLLDPNYVREDNGKTGRDKKWWARWNLNDEIGE